MLSFVVKIKSLIILQEVQQTVAEKTSALEAEAFKTKRMQEETAILKRKVNIRPQGGSI